MGKFRDFLNWLKEDTVEHRTFRYPLEKSQLSDIQERVWPEIAQVALHTDAILFESRHAGAWVTAASTAGIFNEIARLGGYPFEARVITHPENGPDRKALLAIGSAALIEDRLAFSGDALRTNVELLLAATNEAIKDDPRLPALPKPNDPPVLQSK